MCIFLDPRLRAQGDSQDSQPLLAVPVALKGFTLPPHLPGGHVCLLAILACCSLTALWPACPHCSSLCQQGGCGGVSQSMAGAAQVGGYRGEHER